jgi:hypothetical protein
MADNLAYYGFRLFRGATTEPPQVFRAPVASNYDSTTPVGTAGCGFHVGDPVTLLSTGMVQQLVISDGSPTEAEFAFSYGCVVGIEPYFDITLGQVGAMKRATFLPTGITYGTNLERQSNLLLVSMAGNVFEVDCDDNVTATTLAAYQALVGENCALSYSAVAPNSFPKLDISTHKTAIEQFRIVGISPTLANQDFSGNNVKLLVTGNLVQDAPFTTAGF